MFLIRLSFSHIPLRFLLYLLNRLDHLCHLKVLRAGSHMAQQIPCRKKSNEQISEKGFYWASLSCDNPVDLEST